MCSSDLTIGLRLLLKGVIAAIIGGVGSIGGAVLGAFLLAFVENLGIIGLAAEWKDAIAEARRAHNKRTAEYLLGLPMLGDYLEEGLAAFGESCE